MIPSNSTGTSTLARTLISIPSRVFSGPSVRGVVVVAAVVAEQAFLSLDAPIARLAIPDVPTPYNLRLMNAVLPSVEGIAAKMQELLEF